MRLGRPLLLSPRLIYKYNFNENPNKLVCVEEWV